MVHSVVLALLAAASGFAAEFPIALPASPGAVDRLAASELARYLGRLYPDESFTVVEQAPAKGRAIVLERFKGKPESFRVTALGERAVIAGADARGLLYGVYALLEKLGCGFYLSYEAVPPGKNGPLSFDGWTLDDEPLFGDRVVFNWHNFLSSGSTWEFEDWQRYIDNSTRMRFNDLMVHAYGNNPMFEFEFNGLKKPVGYLATTRAGRDWGTQHVNDVRRLIGGEVFHEPVFGASVAKVEPSQRTQAATALMQRVFAHAASRGMGVTFALDVDTVPANPQDLIRTLPAGARFRAGQYEFANPDTPEGYQYYRTQVEQLLRTYPQITRLAVWFRRENTPIHAIKREELPEEWQNEFAATSGDAKMFTLAKLVGAFGRALKDTGHGDVELATGSWRLEFLAAADEYMPKNVTVMPLDWSTVFDTAPAQRMLRQVRSGRKLAPIVWAHHDDRTYIGRSYTPYVNFAGLLRSSGSQGFGIIHWTTRPLDLYFKSTITQAWKSTENQALETTCEEMAARSFGEPARKAGGEYLFAWVTEAPMFGRETSDRFMDIPLPDPTTHRRMSQVRREMLARIDASALTTEARSRLDYYRHYERFMDLFFESHSGLERAQEAVKAGDLEKARREILNAKPADTIHAYAEAAQCGVMTKGEQALIISLNLRWLPYVVSMRQALGLEPARYRIGEVQREPLAQGAGRNTFYFDEQGLLWRVVERGAGNVSRRLGAMMGDKLESGRYSVNGGPAMRARDGKVTVAVTPATTEIVLAKVK